ncbi:putative Holliday junction resolvase [Chlamydiales bacterium STE3]|nr:putative Holliday junction resolvase [Chlamydiales bacterium STE3]
MRKEKIMAKQSRIIGIDYGMMRIGLSYSDPTKLIAMPLIVFASEKKTEKTVEKLYIFLKDHALKNDYEIEEIVVGLPLLLSGKQGLLADEVNHFVEELNKVTSVPIKLWDERLTTVQAERTLMQSSLTRKKRAKVVDVVSAIIILQNYLDSKQANI